MRKRHVFTGGLVVLPLAGSVASAGVYDVGPGQTYTTIQVAVNAAAATDISNPTPNTPPASPVDIVVFGGTYNEDVSIPADPGGGSAFASQNDFWTIQAAPNATVWLDGNITVGNSRDNGTVNGINFNFDTTNTFDTVLLYAGDTSYWTIENSILYSPNAASVDGYSGIYAEDNYGPTTLDHDTFFNISYAADAEYQGHIDAHNCIFANGIVGAVADVTYDHSLFFNNSANSSAGAVDGGNNIYGQDPMFASTDPNSPDFLELSPGSPAIGAASDSGLYAGNDIGARGVVGPVSLAWNNSGAGSPSDGTTWDTSNNNWNNGTAATTYSDGSNVVFNDSNDGNYKVTLNTTVSPASVNVDNSTGNYSITGTGTIVATGGFTKSGTSTLTLGVGLTANSMAITGGNVVIASNTTSGTWSTANPNSNINISSLSIAASSVLDITNNHIVIDYSNSDPMSTIIGYLKLGFNNGTWNGTTGIISSTAQTPTNGLHYGIGFADGNDGTHAVSGLTSGEIELKYTLLGDANLDGTVNGSDFSILAANFGLGVTNWDQGNFLYGSSVNGSDFSALAANFGQGDSGAAMVTPADIAALHAFAAANGLLADVPEPGTFSTILVAAALVARRRKRRM